MPAVLVALLGFVVSSVIVKILFALGVGFFTYTGLTALIDQLLGYVSVTTGGLPASIIQMMNLAGFSQAFGIVSAALVARATIQSMKVFVGATNI